jgi:hypothetical protein
MPPPIVCGFSIFALSLQQQREGGFVTACGKLMDALRASIDAQKKKAPAPSTQA